MLIDRDFEVTTQQDIIIGSRRSSDPVQTVYSVRAKTAKGAARAVRDAGHRGTIVKVARVTNA